jgi:hypothetical protein
VQFVLGTHSEQQVKKGSAETMLALARQAG